MDPDIEHPNGIRLRVGLGAGVVLVVVAVAIAVVLTALAAHPSATSSGYSGSNSAYRSSTTKTSSPAAAASAADQANLGAGNGSSALVQVGGQVVKPGLYELSTGSRVVDAIAAAGGFTARADQTSLNLAQVVADGQQIVVPVKGAAPTASTTTSGKPTVDLNTADATALETLDGIGPALAQRILAYRTVHGGFRSVNDLQNVTGIGPKKFAAIKASVSL